MRRKVRLFKRLPIILILIAAAIYPTLYYTSSEIVEITVSKTERISTGSGEDLSHKFLIYTEGEVFENTDSWLYMKHNSTDIQNKAKTDSTYSVKVAGWRIPLISSYRNVIEIN